MMSLEDSIPGIPGQDYPIYAMVQETGFSCSGKVLKIFEKFGLST